MVTRTTVAPDRAAPPADGTGQPVPPGDRSAQADLCRHCRYNPASQRIFGYCSWDCHDEDEGEGPTAA
jgi:hypothetical protein